MNRVSCMMWLVAAAGCLDQTQANPGAGSADWLPGKADDPSTGADNCPGPYSLGAQFLFQGLQGNYLRSDLTSARPGDLMSASFAIDPSAGAALASGSYSVTTFGAGTDAGAFQEVQSVALPAFLLITDGETAEHGDGYIVVKANVEADGSISRMCVQRLLHRGVVEASPAFDLAVSGS